MNRLGSMMASLMGTKPPVTGSKKTITSATPSTAGFVIVLVIIGVLLILLAWGKQRE
jgi:hypothetical protein